MWTTLAFATLTLLPHQAAKLSLTNARITHGIQGPTRTGTKFLPGDQLVICFDVEGLKADDDGKVQYSIGLKVTDSKGDLQFKQDPTKLQANNALGGDSMPAFANIKIGLNQEPGSYKVTVTVNDLAAKTSAELTQSYDVLKKDFGLVRLSTTLDPDGKIPAPLPAAGQTLLVNFAAVGFDRKSEQPNLEVTMRVLDDQGRPTVAKPFTGAVTKGIPKQVLAVPMQFALTLNRAGKFKIEVKATDKVSGKTATLTFPLTVSKVK
jgi:hypothetical protein